MKFNILKFIIEFTLYILLQIILMLHFTLFGYAFAFVYPVILIRLPVTTPRLLLQLIAFITGITIDIFSNTPGLHTASCVLIAFLRPLFLSALSPHGGYDSNMSVSIQFMGLKWFVSFLTLNIFLHHYVLFMLETFSFTNFGFTLGKIIFSTIFSVVMITLIQILTGRPFKTIE